VQTKIYTTIIVPEALYGCETWSLTFKVKTRARRVPEYDAEENI
jgi:hypothetical protein